MNKINHTPGPWKATEHGEIFSPEPTPSHVASVNQFPNHSESEANARLIAAAPDLLAALENAVESLTVCADDSEEAGYPSRADAVRNDLVTYRAAIAKAKGEK